MKINKQTLRQIIKEELQNVLSEDELQDELDGDTLAGKTIAYDEEGNEISDEENLERQRKRSIDSAEVANKTQIH